MITIAELNRTHAQVTDRGVSYTQALTIVVLIKLHHKRSQGAKLIVLSSVTYSTLRCLRNGKASKRYVYIDTATSFNLAPIASAFWVVFKLLRDSETT